VNMNELHTGLAASGQTNRHRLEVKFTGLLMLFWLLATVTLFLGSYWGLQVQRQEYAAVPPVEAQAKSWIIEGALTEACTCSVPCTCNFGEGPSPHHYCYSLYSYDIRKGKYGDTTLDGLHFGGTELKSGRTFFIDERANERQREALRVIVGRVIQKLSAVEAETRAKSAEPDVRYTAIQQEYDDRRNHLVVAGVGEFAATYIFGWDKKNPLIVRNNTTWRILDAIKAKTTVYQVKVGGDSINTNDTNSNQGDFTYSDKSDFGAPEYSNCSSTMNSQAQLPDDERWCGK
jgi:hypothetical protein